VIPGVTTTATLSGQVRDETDPWKNDGFGNVWFSIEEEYDLDGTATIRGLACCSITQTSKRYIDRMTKRFRLPEVTAENLA
jgi:ribosomal protein L5